MTLQTGRTHHRHRACVIAVDIEDAVQKLSQLEIDAELERLPPPRVQQTVGFMFTGQGSQYVRMAQQLYDTHPLFRAVLERCDEILIDAGYPEYVWQGLQEESKMSDTRFAQVAIFCVSYALAVLWQSWGVEPAVVLGHSVGELVAAVVGECMVLHDALQMVVSRGSWMASCAPGGMMVVQCSGIEGEAAVTEFNLQHRICLAAHNSPLQCVLSGDVAALHEFASRMSKKGIKCKQLGTDRAFHNSSRLQAAVEGRSKFEEVCKEVRFQRSQVKWVSTATGSVMAEPPSAAYWLLQAEKPVLFQQSIETFVTEGVDLWLEVGSHPTLCPLGQLSAPSTTGSSWLWSLQKGHSNWESVLKSVSKLYLAGHRINWVGFSAPFAFERILLPNYAFQRQRFWGTSLINSAFSNNLFDSLSSSLPVFFSDAAKELIQLPNVRQHFDSLCLTFVLSAFSHLTNLHVGDVMDINILFSCVPPHHHSYVKWCVTLLTEEGFLKEISGEGNCWCSLKAFPTDSDLHGQRELLKKKILSSHRQFQVDLSLLCRCGEHLIEVLRGNINPLALLFPSDPKIVGAVEFYRKSLFIAPYNAILGQVIKDALKTTAGKKIRVVEVGAGTGGTTAVVLPILQDLEIEFEYVYTDVSSSFFPRARAEFSGVKFRLLNIENDIETQDFQQGYFDLVIAANSLHTTKDVSRSLRNVRKLLSGEGSAILLEMAESVRWIDMIFGLITGWWNFEDDIRVDSPLIRPAKWESALINAGFEKTCSAALHEQAVIVAKNSFQHLKPDTHTTTVEIPEQQFVPQLEPPFDCEKMMKYVIDIVCCILHRTCDSAIDKSMPFLSMGFDSLMFVELANAIQQQFSHHAMSLSTAALMDQSCVMEMYTFLMSQVGQHTELQKTNAMDDSESSSLSCFPASAGQHRHVYLQDSLSDKSAYNVPVGLKMGGSVNVSALHRALIALVSRHSGFRSHFAWEGDKLMVKISTDVHLLLQVDMTTSDFLEGKVDDLVKQPFDLYTGPLFRAALLQTEQNENIFLFVVHHTIIDGSSVVLFLNELQTLYNDICTSDHSTHLRVIKNYSVFSSWQQQWCNSSDFENQSEFWKHELFNISVPFEWNRGVALKSKWNSNNGRSVGVYRKVLPIDKYQQFESWCKSAKVTVFSGMLSVLALLLRHYGENDDFLIGTAVDNRSATPGMQGVLGYFINTVAIRITVDDAKPVSSFVRAVWRSVKAALSNALLPFDQVVQHARLSNAKGPIQVFFSMNELPELSFENLEVDYIEDMASSEFDFSLDLFKKSGIGMEFVYKYSSQLFDPDTVACMVNHFEIMLDSLIQPLADNFPIGNIFSLSPAELDELSSLNNTQSLSGLQFATLHSAFQHQCSLNPEQVMVCNEIEMKYHQIFTEASNLASRIASVASVDQKLVAIAFKREMKLIIAIWSVLIAGAGYLPLDLSYPTDRLDFMLSDAKPALLLTTREYASSLPDTAVPIVFIDDHDLSSSADVPKSHSDGTSLAYVMYTSGSTGVPKGVMVEHHSVLNYCFWAGSSNSDGPVASGYDISAKDTMLARSSVCFDASVSDLLCPMLLGAKILLADDEAQKDPQKMAILIQTHKATVIDVTPSLLRYLVDFCSPESFKTVRLVISGGEELSNQLRQQFFVRFPWADLHNSYGPTETTCVSFDAALQQQSDTFVPVPIGRPISNTQLYVLDRNLQIVPTSMVGELYIGGLGVARGYLNRPELTSQRFIANPHSRLGRSSRIYKTGDRVRVLQDGQLQFLGRFDDQFKLRGFRVEPAEIEEVARQNGATDAAVVLCSKKISGEQLVCFFTSEGQRAVSSSLLRTSLQAVLPTFMVPTVVQLDSLPKMSNQKVDRIALKQIAANMEIETLQVSAPPRTWVEFQLAKIWKLQLGLGKVGIHDSFFALGGHSLLVLRLIAQVKEVFGKSISISSVYAHQTIAGIATLLDSVPDMTPPDILTLQKQSADSPVIFFVHPGAGTVFPYLGLLPFLPRYTIFGINNPRLSTPEDQFHSLEEMAAAYVSAVQEKQPHGPYLLAGWSLGGVVAREMARQLQKEGEVVTKIVMIDSIYLGALEPIVKKEVAGAKEQWVRDGVLADHREAFRGETNLLLAAYTNAADLVLRYEPSHCSAKTVLLRAEAKNQDATSAFVSPLPQQAREALQKLMDDPCYGWDRVGEDILVHSVPGSHHELFSAKFIQTTACGLAACLEVE